MLKYFTRFELGRDFYIFHLVGIAKVYTLGSIFSIELEVFDHYRLVTTFLGLKLKIPDA